MIWAITVAATTTTPKRTYFTEAVDQETAVELVRVNYPQLRDIEMHVVEVKGASPTKK